MHVGQISFCDGFGYNIKSDEDKERISEELKSLNISVLSRQYERFGTDTTIRAVKSNPHLLSVRTHGNPYFMFLTTVNGVQQCIFIDKKIQPGFFHPRMILTKLWFDADLFSGTVFEGEMVSSTNTWTFLINDLVVDRGLHLGNVNLVRRVNYAYEILSKKFARDGMDPCKLEIKRYFPYEGLHDMVNTFIPTLPYGVRGIVFKSLFLKFRDILVDVRDEAEIRQGRERMKSKRKDAKVTNDFKLLSKSMSMSMPVAEEVNVEKEKIIQMFDMKMTSMPDVYELFHKGIKTDVACIPNIAISKEMRDIFAKVSTSSTINMRCAYNERFKKWVPEPVILL